MPCPMRGFRARCRISPRASLALALVLATAPVVHAERLLQPRFASPEQAAPARVLAASTYDPLWTRYPLPNVSGTVYAMVPFAGGMAMAGDARYWGTTFSDHVALWDGSGWQALGDGVPVTVRALAVYNGQLIAAGFNNGVLYAWDGATWTTIGDAGGPVNALLVSGNDLYAGGQFFNVDGVSATMLARWDGVAWHEAGTDLGRPRQSGGGIYVREVRALALHGGVLYAGGVLPGFEGIARWTGSVWDTVGAGFQSGTLAGSVDALASDGTTLFACGGFNASGVTPLTRIAAWNGLQWSGLPGATVAGSALAVFGGQLVGTVPDAGVSRPQFWNGATWNPYNHPNVIPQGYGSDGANLYASGSLSQSSGATPTFLGGFYRFDGVAWSPMQLPWTPGMKGIQVGSAQSAQEYHGSLFVGGAIGYFGAGDHFEYSPGVGRWDGTTWNPVATGAGGQYFDMTVWNDSLVAAVDGTVKIWNGSSWRRLAPTQASYTFDWTYGVTVANGDLYVLGPLYQNNPYTDLYGVGRWTGSTWAPLGYGIDDPYGYAQTGTEWNQGLAVGGQFASASGVPVRNLAWWDGAAWHDLGGGVNTGVSTLLASGGDLIVGGYFTEAGGQPITGVARWDGSAWHAMGQEAIRVDKLREHAGRIYAVGAFLDDALQEVHGAAVWNGTRWLLLGTGIGPTGSLNSLAFLGDDLYIIGSFGTVGGQPSRGFAKLTNVSTLDVTPNAQVAHLELAPTPNPSRGTVRFAVTLPAAGRARLVIRDVAGREVARLIDGPHAAGAFTLAWEGRVAPGLYFATLEAAGERTTTRVARLR